MFNLYNILSSFLSNTSCLTHIFPRERCSHSPQQLYSTFTRHCMLYKSDIENSHVYISKSEGKLVGGLFNIIVDDKISLIMLYISKKNIE